MLVNDFYSFYFFYSLFNSFKITVNFYLFTFELGTLGLLSILIWLMSLLFICDIERLDWYWSICDFILLDDLSYNLFGF